MYLGIDIGTSGVKAVLAGEEDTVIDQATAPLEVSQPKPLWSEQNPTAWWDAVQKAVLEVQSRNKESFAALKAIGLSGQMHGATLLDESNKVLRPAILWNDGRCATECTELEAAVPGARDIAGNIAMPGFTAPKLLWVKKHEPDVFSRVKKVLLPKDYVRLMLTGEYASDLSDSAGTLWLDVKKRAWSKEMLAASGLDESQMPKLFEGSESTGTVRAALADEWGIPKSTVVAAGAGDNAAGAVGVGVVKGGSALLSLGTSGVYFTASDEYAAKPDGAVHSFCHCLPGRFHQMSVILSAASCLDWVSKLTGAQSVAALLAEVDEEQPSTGDLLFLPYLSGERTPHNDPYAQGVFFGLTHSTTRAALARSVLEGVAFAFADGQKVLLEAGTTIEDVTVIGGGARSDLWGDILASVLGRQLTYREGGSVGPAFGAARLARLSVSGEAPEDFCSPPPIQREVHPGRELSEQLAPKLERYQALYRAVKESFPR